MQVDQQETKKQTKGEYQKRPRDDKRPRNNRDQKTNGEKTETFEKKEKKDNQPRKPRFEPPADWKEQLEKTVTIDSKVPTLPVEGDRLQKPNYNKLRNDIDFCEEEIQKHYDKIDILKEDQKKIRHEVSDKNFTIKDDLKKLRDERKTFANALSENKELKKQYTEKMNNFDEQMRATEKKSQTGKLMKKQDLLDMIKNKEEEFKNTKKTSAEEKKMNDEIQRLKLMIKSIPEFEKLKDEKYKYNDLIKELNKNSSEIFDKLTKVNKSIFDLEAKLGETTIKIKQEKEEEQENGKKKYVPTPAESDIEAAKQVHFNELKKLKDKKQKLREKYEEDWTNFEKQQFELDKIYIMQKIQKNLKREEREKKRKEEDEKQKLLDEEKAKEFLQFKYHEEINLCDSLITILEDLKPDKKTQKTFVEAKEVTEHTVDNEKLKQDNLVYLKPKKFNDSVDSVVNKKKNKQQKNQKKEVPVTTNETDKVNIHFESLNLFNEIKVVPPTNFAQLDGVISQLNEKKEYYLNLRAKEMDEAVNVKPTGENKNNSEEVVEEKQQKEKSARKPKAVELKEDDFPEL